MPAVTLNRGKFPDRIHRGQARSVVIALDKWTGKEIRKCLNDPVSNSSPLVVEAGGKRQLIVWTDESVASLNPATGEIFCLNRW